MWENDAAYLEIVQDLLDTPEVQSLENFVHHKVTNRLAHCLSVSYRSYTYAKFLGLDTRAVARAGLLHDLFFYESADKDQVGGRGHNYEHPRIALENARKLTELSAVEEDIILKHMAGATRDIPLYAESWLVSLVDKQCAILEVSVGAKDIFKLNYQEYVQYLLNWAYPSGL